ncbi:MAG TPA: class I adenylate-forming enzyme family protein [Verrucomicrobiae bacterium]|nr:class I adenylate-forming enzyme family protein [Verrucomicrobiae bacterium]
MNEDQTLELIQSLPSRIPDVVKPWAEASPDHLALVEASGKWTYSELSRAISEAEKLLREKGVRRGDRVMIVGENGRAFIALLFGVLGAGAWVVPVNARLSAREVDEIRDHCGARCVIYITGNSPQARQHAKRHGAEILDFAGAGAIGLGAINESAEPEPDSKEDRGEIAALIYTSGTTGRPKGVMLTHRNILFVAGVSAQIRSLTPEDRMYGVLPMSHIVAFSVVLVGTLLSGATLYLAPFFNPMAVLAAFEKDKITVMLGVPSMYALLLEYAKSRGLEKLDYPSLRILSTSGAPLYPGLKRGIERLFGKVLNNGYGVSEMSPNVAQTRIEAPRSDISVGPVLPGIQARLIGKDGMPVPEGEVGELHVCGPNMMKGYYRAPEETAAAFDAEGWFNTRDLARFEGENLHIVGRSKELIVRFGFNVYPAEVEAVLNSHPAVLRSAVIGRAGEDVVGEEEVIAFVQLVPEAPATIKELAEHAARNLSPYKQPTQIVIVPAMPETPTGKIVKNELAKMIPLQTPAS